MSTSLEITLLGMGSVFFFLYLMTEVLDLIRVLIPNQKKTQNTDLLRVAAAVVSAQKLTKKQ